MRRDVWMQADDWVVVNLDTFHDHRNAFGFAVNALGTKFDFTLRDESQYNFNWDETWEARSEHHRARLGSRARHPVRRSPIPHREPCLGHRVESHDRAHPRAYQLE